MPCSVNMYFGESVKNGQYNVFMSDGLPVEILDYDCHLLSTALELDFDSFKLTEKELLSTASLNGWLHYGASSQDNDILVVKVFKALFGAGGFAELIAISARTLNAILDHHDASGLNEVLSKFAVEETAEAFIKLQQAYEWLKDVHSTYYGKKYLIQVGDQNSGVCIKDKFGNRPTHDLKVEAEGGVYYTSDMPATAGAWPNPGQTQILGLDIGPETFLFQESDNRVGAFVKIEDYQNITRFGLDWEIDLSKVSDDSFYIKDNSLFLKAGVTEILYQVNLKQYVLVDLSDSPLLRLTLGADKCQSNLLAQGAQSLLILFGDADTEEKPFEEVLAEIFCDDKENVLRGGPHNKSAFNLLNSHKPTIIPDNFIIPARSNVFVYGPWFFQANPVGGTIVESNKDLCPWKFSNGYDDGYERMNTYGNLIAYDGPRGLQKQESGSITVASLPSYNIGYIVGANAATLTDININIGDNGFTTTYNFQTYTPKFGSPGRQLADLWSKNYKSLVYINKFFKDQRIKLNQLINKNKQGLQERLGEALNRKKFTVGEVDNEDKAGLPSGKSPGLLLMSGYFFEDYETNASGGSPGGRGSNGSDGACITCRDLTYPPPSIGAGSSSSDGNILQNRPFTNLDKGHTSEYIREHTFNRLAISTLDLILSPITTYQEDDPDGRNADPLPRLAFYHGSDGISATEFQDKPSTVSPGDPPRSRPRNVIPPFTLSDELQADLPIHQQYLNSVTSQQMLNYWDGRQNGSDKGFITHLISYGTDFKDFTFTITNDDEDNRQNSSVFRYNALRGPLTLQSWGYDITGKPIPNAVDSAAACEAGQFAGNGLKDKFLKNWLNNPKTWPVGPIDLRWDRDRGVWVAPPANKIVLARLTESLSAFGSAEAELLNTSAGGIQFYQNYDIWDDQGGDVRKGINTAKIKVYDFLGVNYCKCDVIYAYYDDNRYIILESQRSYPTDTVCCPTTTTTETTTLPPTTPPPPPPPPTPPPATVDCWCGLECLKTLTNYQAGEHQALVHKVVGGADCLYWEDIVECDATGLPSDTSLVESDSAASSDGMISVTGLETEQWAADGIAVASVSLDSGASVLQFNPNRVTDTDAQNFLTATASSYKAVNGGPNLHIDIDWIFDSAPFNFDYLEAGEQVSFTYLIDVLDSNGDSLLINVESLTITITGTDEAEPVVTPVNEGARNELLYANGYFAFLSRNYDAPFSQTDIELTELKTNTNRFYDYVSRYDNVPDNATLLSFLQVSHINSREYGDHLVYMWNWSTNIDDGYPMNYLAKDEYMHLTYTITFENPDGDPIVRVVTIELSGTNNISVGRIDGNNVSRTSIPGTTNTQIQISTTAEVEFPIEDLDHSDGNITATIDEVEVLGVSDPRILNYPEWPSDFRSICVLSITNQKNEIINNIADTDAYAKVIFNSGNVYDFSFLGRYDSFILGITVSITDAGGNTITVTGELTYSGWNDNATMELSFLENGNNTSIYTDTDGDRVIDTKQYVVVQEGLESYNPDNDKPHFMRQASDTDLVLYVDPYLSGEDDVYFFFDLKLSSADRSAISTILSSVLLPSSSYSTTDLIRGEVSCSSINWSDSECPDILYAVNLSNTDKGDPATMLTNYSTDLANLAIRGASTDGELEGYLNIAIRIPWQLLHNKLRGQNTANSVINRRQTLINATAPITNTLNGSNYVEYTNTISLWDTFAWNVRLVPIEDIIFDQDGNVIPTY